MKSEVSPLKKHIDESPKIRELRERRRRRRSRVAWLLVAFFVVLAAGFVYATRLPRFQLTTVKVSGNQVVNTQDIVANVNLTLSGNYAYLIPHRDTFFYPKEKIIAGLLASFPRFESVTVYRTDLNTILVTVVEVHGRALWCGTNAAAPDFTAPCYFTDDVGKIVAPSPLYSGDVYPRFFGGTITANEMDPIGMTFIDAAHFQDLIDFDSAVTALGFQVKAIEISGGDEDDLLLDLGQGKTAPVRFLAADDYTLLASNLSAALGESELAASLKTDRSNLEYFDLRFPNKVYYKFSDQ